MSQLQSQKVSYIFENVFNERLNDETFARMVEEIYNVQYSYLTGKSEPEKHVECGPFTKGKVMCYMDANVVNVLPPWAVAYMINQASSLVKTLLGWLDFVKEEEG